MAKLLDHPPHDDEEEIDEEDIAVILPFFLASIFALWVVASIYIGRSFGILDILSGAGLLGIIIAMYVSLNRRLQLVEQQVTDIRAADDEYPSDEYSGQSVVDHRSFKANRL